MVAKIVYFLFSAYSMGLIVYVLCSWVKHPKVTALRSWLGKWYEPFLDPLRREIKRLTKGEMALDFSPLILLVGISVVRWLVVRLLISPF